MSREQFENEKMYAATMHIARMLYKQGVITKEQYKQIDTIFIKKYEPFLACIYSDLA